MLSTVYINGEYLTRDEAMLHVSDLSILRGYGVFDYFRYADRRPRFVSDHLARLRNSARMLHLPLHLSDDELSTVVSELIDRNSVDDGGIRFVLTGGYAEDGYTPESPNLLGLPSAFTPVKSSLYETGCTVLLHRYTRQLPRAKTIDYVEGIRIQPLLRQAAAQYPLYVDDQEDIRESDRSNVMIVRDGTLITPREGMLLGITRLHLLRIAHQLGIPVEERPVSVTDLLTADEALICSSVKGAMPITRAVGAQAAFGDRDFDRPGPVVKRLMAAWADYV